MYKSYSSEEIKLKIKLIKEIDKDFNLIESGEYFTVEKKDEIIGYACFTKDGEVYTLKKIFIKDEERYKSYGSKLLHFIVNKKIKKGDIVVKESKELENFLKKLGFKKEENGVYTVREKDKKEDRKVEGTKIVLNSIFWNIILAATKISFGITGKSRALVADGFNSLSDVVTSSGILLGIHFSNIPEDEDHPFGHERIESVIGVIMGIFMILTAFELTKNGIEALILKKTHEIPAMSTVFFAGFSSVVKYFMYKQKIRVGLKTENAALIADAKDSRNDIFSSLGVIVAIILSIYVNPIFDTIISILVALVIFKEGLSVIFETTNMILDKQDKEFISEIENYIYENTDLTNVHDIVMRKSGNKIFLLFHIRVSKDMTVYEAHKIADDLELSIIEDFPVVKSVDVHIDSLIY